MARAKSSNMLQCPYCKKLTKAVSEAQLKLHFNYCDEYKKAHGEFEEPESVFDNSGVCKLCTGKLRLLNRSKLAERNALDGGYKVVCSKCDELY